MPIPPNLSWSRIWKNFLTSAAVTHKNQRLNKSSIMAKYRARQCPKCNYFVGFAVAKQLVKAREVSVTNFCLNCNYKLPVHTIVRGARRPIRSSWRATLRLVRIGPTGSAIAVGAQPRQKETD